MSRLAFVFYYRCLQVLIKLFFTWQSFLFCGANNALVHAWPFTNKTLMSCNSLWVFDFLKHPAFNLHTVNPWPEIIFIYYYSGFFLVVVFLYILFFYVEKLYFIKYSLPNWSLDKKKKMSQNIVANWLFLCKQWWEPHRNMATCWAWLSGELTVHRQRKVCFRLYTKVSGWSEKYWSQSHD